MFDFVSDAEVKQAGLSVLEFDQMDQDLDQQDYSLEPTKRAWNYRKQSIIGQMDWALSGEGDPELQEGPRLSDEEDF